MKAKLRAVILAVALVTTGIGASHAEVATHVKPINVFGSLNEFSTTETPCFVKAPGWNPDDIPQLRKLFAEAGMNVDADKNATCHIMVRGYVTISNGEDKPVTPVNAEYLLQNQDKPIEVGPALSVTDTNAAGAASDASGMIQSVSASDIEVLSRAGNMVAGTTGSVIAVVAAALVDVATGIAARNKTKDGVASITASVYHRNGNGFFKTTEVSMEIYAASTTKETPAALIRAAVNRFVHELQLREQADKKKAAEKSAAASASGGEWGGSVQ